MFEIAVGIWLGLSMFAASAWAVIEIIGKIARVRSSRYFGQPWKYALRA